MFEWLPWALIRCCKPFWPWPNYTLHWAADKCNANGFNSTAVACFLQKMYLQIAASRSASAEDLRQSQWLSHSQYDVPEKWELNVGAQIIVNLHLKKWLNYISMWLWLKSQCGTNQSSFPLKNSQCFDQCLELSTSLLCCFPATSLCSKALAVYQTTITVAHSLKKIPKAFLPPSLYYKMLLRYTLLEYHLFFSNWMDRNILVTSWLPWSFLLQATLMKPLRNNREAVVGPTYGEAKELRLSRILVWSGAETTAAPIWLAPHKAMGLSCWLGIKMMTALVLFLDGKSQTLCGVLFWG